MRIYLDAAPNMSHVENAAVLGALASARINAPGDTLVSCDLAWMEALVQPLRAGNAALVQDFDDFFAMRVAELVPLSGRVLRSAATIRAQFRFKTPDAIHLAAAVDANCDAFLTNDAQLARFTGIAVEVVN